MGTSGTRSWDLREVQSPRESREPLEIPLQSLPGQRYLSGVEAGNSGFLSRSNMDLRVPMGCPQGSQFSSRVEPCKSAVLSSRESSVRLPVDQEIGAD